jgi:hypothetical protein
MEQVPSKHAEQMHKNLNDAKLPQKLKYLINILAPKSFTHRDFMV